MNLNNPDLLRNHAYINWAWEGADDGAKYGIEDYVGIIYLCMGSLDR